ncbi:histone H1/5 [Mytilus galloprovincialis]|uniref:Histone H1/5 n=1 Tax=Mytilus galloprovincialis TaxID=29158 RepID=A0A8B6BJX7_MYTGA|nr:histone H1/5 [Mytilus galloprovincialis]
MPSSPRKRSQSRSPAKKARKTPRKPRAKGGVKKPTTLSLIVASIQAMKNKKGSSVQAIRKYILANNKGVSAARLGTAMKLAFAKGLKSGVLVRPKSSAGASGATGSFRVGKAPASPKKKAKKAKSPKKKAKKPKNKSNNAKAKKSPRKKTAVKKSSKSKAKTSKKPKSPKKKATKKPTKKRVKKSPKKKAAKKSPKKSKK